MLLDLLHPVLDVLEGALVRHVVHEEDAHGPAVVRRGDGPEALLPRRVPDLQLELLVVQREGLNLEVDAVCVVHGCVIRKSFMRPKAVGGPARPQKNTKAHPIVVMKEGVKESSE